jgi:hypothetical protein
MEWIQVRYKIEYLRHHDDRDPEIIGQTTIDTLDIEAATATAELVLKNSYDADQLPPVAIVSFVVRQNGRIVYPRSSA